MTYCPSGRFRTSGFPTRASTIHTIRVFPYSLGPSRVKAIGLGRAGPIRGVPSSALGSQIAGASFERRFESPSPNPPPSREQASGGAKARLAGGCGTDLIGRAPELTHCALPKQPCSRLLLAGKLTLTVALD